jgi:hypothetical protein
MLKSRTMMATWPNAPSMKAFLGRWRDRRRGRENANARSRKRTQKRIRKSERNRAWSSPTNPRLHQTREKRRKIAIAYYDADDLERHGDHREIAMFT